MLALHAFGGCDTTSVLFGIGKRSVYKILSDVDQHRFDLDLMQSPVASADEVSHAGLRLMIALCEGKSEDTRQILRYRAYCRQVSSSLRRIQPERRPPSKNAAHFHVLRVHHQAVS